MKTLHIRSLSLAALALLLVAGDAAAQNTSPALLSTLEVKGLIAAGKPADHARLSAHYMALAERDEAEAKRHTTMAQSFVGNPSRNLGTGMSIHCKRLAELNTQSATTVRELATYHQKLAAGAAATPPPAGAHAQPHAGMPEPTEQQLSALAAKAGTPADHLALEEYFLTLAKRYSADAKEHAAMAQAYRGTRITSAAVHCDQLVKLSRDLATEATGAAAMHKKLSGAAK
jgi:hypothetical protein